MTENFLNLVKERKGYFQERGKGVRLWEERLTKQNYSRDSKENSPRLPMWTSFFSLPVMAKQCFSHTITMFTKCDDIALSIVIAKVRNKLHFLGSQWYMENARSLIYFGD